MKSFIGKAECLSSLLVFYRLSSLFSLSGIPWDLDLNYWALYGEAPIHASLPSPKPFWALAGALASWGPGWILWHGKYCLKKKKLLDLHMFIEGEDENENWVDFLRVWICCSVVYLLFCEIHLQFLLFTSITHKLRFVRKHSVQLVYRVHSEFKIMEQPVSWHMPLIIALRKQRQEDCCKFNSILGCLPCC